MLLEEDEAERAGTPQRISVLTTEYIAKGLDNTGYSAIEAAEDTRIGEEDWSGILLTDAIVQSLGRIQTPTRTFSCWRVPSMKNVVAILADDIPAQETLLDVWREFNVPFKVTMYVDSFVIEGTILSDDEDPPEFYRQAFRPIEDAMITPQGGRTSEAIRVKLGLVNVTHIHGFSVE